MAEARNHQCAHGFRIGHEAEGCSLASLPSDPGPVGDDHVHRARLQGHLGGLVGGKLDRDGGDAMPAIQSMMPNGVDLPGDSPEPEQTDPDSLILLSRCRSKGDQGQNETGDFQKHGQTLASNGPYQRPSFLVVPLS